MQLEELNSMEEHFLEILDYHVHVKQSKFEQYRNSVQTYFQEPLTPDKEKMVQENMRQLDAVEYLNESQGIDASYFILPAHPLQFLYEDFIKDQLRVI